MKKITLFIMDVGVLDQSNQGDHMTYDIQNTQLIYIALYTHKHMY